MQPHFVIRERKGDKKKGRDVPVGGTKAKRTFQKTVRKCMT